MADKVLEIRSTAQTQDFRERVHHAIAVKAREITDADPLDATDIAMVNTFRGDDGSKMLGRFISGMLADPSFFAVMEATGHPKNLDQAAVKAAVDTTWERFKKLGA